MRCHFKIFCCFLFCLGCLIRGALCHAESPQRFFIEGDGRVTLSNPKTGHTATIQYRLADGTYPEEVQATVDELFGLSAYADVDHISMRLIALLDYIQDTFGDGTKTIRLDSAYRSPLYNEELRDKGRTVAKASTHMEGMAADITIPGVKGYLIWQQLRSKNYKRSFVSVFRGETDLKNFF